MKGVSKLSMKTTNSGKKDPRRLVNYDLTNPMYISFFLSFLALNRGEFSNEKFIFGD